MAGLESGEYQGEYLGYGTLSQLFHTFTPKRWALVERLQKMGPCSLRALASALNRDVKRVHEDVSLLVEEHIIEWTKDRLLHVPYRAICIDAVIFRSAA